MNGEAEKSRGNTAKIAKLRDNAPDLADLVDQHRLDLDGALGQHGGDRRSDQVKDQGETITLKHRGTSAAYVLARLDRNRPDLAALIGLSVRAMNAAGSATASAAAVGPIIPAAP